MAAPRIFEVTTRVDRDGQKVIVDSRLVKADTATKARSFVSKLFNVEADIPTQEEMLAHGKAGHPVYDATKIEPETGSQEPMPEPSGQDSGAAPNGQPEIF